MNINFPHLGIKLEHVGQSISIFGFHITYYGMLTGLALFAGIVITIYFVAKSGRKYGTLFRSCNRKRPLGNCMGKNLVCVCFPGKTYGGHLSPASLT